jgi:hypothetical protein
VPRKLAVLGLALVLLAIALWLALTRASSTSVPVADDSAAPRAARASAVVDRSEPEPGKRAEAGAASPRPQMLCVRSSAGIPLAFLEVEREGTWTRHELVEGCTAALTDGLRLRARAPGHVERTLEPFAGELVLEPDALLLIEAAQLRSCLDEFGIEESACRIELEFLEARTRAVAAGWVSDTCFGIAVACERLEPLPRQLQVRLVRADRKQTFLTLEPRTGMRERWRMPCDGMRAGVPLEVRVERPAGPRGPVTVFLHCPKESDPGVELGTFSWGTVGGFSSDISEQRTIEANEEVARFPFALQGRTHLVVGLDMTTHAYGRTEFVHDGTQRMLALRAGLEFRGRIVEAESGQPLRSVYLRFQGEDVPGWFIEAQHEELDPHGNFALRGPPLFAMLSAESLEPPRRFALIVQAPGFDDGALLVERTEAQVLDVGEISLVRHKNPLVLGPGHGIDPKVLDGQYVAFADKPEELWSTLVGVAREGGRLEIEFARSQGMRATPLVTRANLLSGEESGAEFDRPLGSTLFVHVVDDVRSFRLATDGMYHPLPEESLDLVLRTESPPPAGGNWRIGWTWDGAWVGVGQLASAVAGSETKARITIPRGAQQLWWSSSGLPPDLHGDPGGFQAITGSSMKVVLR